MVLKKVGSYIREIRLNGDVVIPREETAENTEIDIQASASATASANPVEVGFSGPNERVDIGSTYNGGQMIVGNAGDVSLSDVESFYFEFSYESTGPLSSTLWVDRSSVGGVDYILSAPSGSEDVFTLPAQAGSPNDWSITVPGGASYDVSVNDYTLYYNVSGGASIDSTSVTFDGVTQL